MEDKVWFSNTITWDLFNRAHIKRGQQRYEKDDYEGALQDFEVFLLDRRCSDAQLFYEAVQPAAHRPVRDAQLALHLFDVAPTADKREQELCALEEIGRAM